MAFGDTATLVDNFNRSVGNLSTEAAYDQMADSTPASTLNGSALHCNASNYTGITRVQETWGPNCEIYFELVTVGGATVSSNYIGLWIVNSLTTGADGYKAATNNGNVVLNRVDNFDSDAAQLDTAVYDLPTAGGMGIELNGSSIKTYTKATSGGAWTERCSVTDSTHSGPWYIIIDVFDPAGNDVHVTNLYAGTLGGGGGSTVTPQGIIVPNQAVIRSSHY